MEPRIAVISLWADDVPAAAHFYRDVIGLKLLHHPGERPHFEVNGIYLTILKGHPSPAQDAVPARFPLVAFAVDNLDASLAKLSAHKVELPWGIEQDASSRWVMFHDPTGNLIELVEFGQ
jgi:catechol 2,3-dioxygenase-like lactoylglutathione lyase family enzyme